MIRQKIQNHQKLPKMHRMQFATMFYIDHLSSYHVAIQRMNEILFPLDAKQNSNPTGEC